MTSQGPVQRVTRGNSFSFICAGAEAPGEGSGDACQCLERLLGGGRRREAGKQTRCPALQGRLGVGGQKWGQDWGLGCPVCRVLSLGPPHPFRTWEIDSE